MPFTPAGKGYLIEDSFDRSKRRPTDPAIEAKVLYHYTSWAAANEILVSQRMWATAHDCTNDTSELIAADRVIQRALHLRARWAPGMAGRLLGLCARAYPGTRIGAVPRTYFVSFSGARDDERQWRRYGAGGAGVCVGFRPFGVDEPDPVIPSLSTSFMPVNYSYRGLVQKVNAWFAEYLAHLSRRGLADGETNWRIALETFRTSATAWALTFKDKQWAAEREVRFICIVREGHRVAPLERTRPDGRRVRYWSVPLTSAPLMPVSEFIIGPNQDATSAIAKARTLLEAAGYRPGTPDGPAIALSSLLAFPP